MFEVGTKVIINIDNLPNTKRLEEVVKINKVYTIAAVKTSHGKKYVSFEELPDKIIEIKHITLV